jgi:L-aspartate oxidase
MIRDFEHHFPTIWSACQLVGLDPQREWLPIAPAAHYMSGGVVTDLDGATTLPRLWACGETACTGVHGANRLASNSLLDGLVFGQRVVEGILVGKSEPAPTGAMAGVLDLPPGRRPEPDPIVLPKSAGERVTPPDELLASAQRVMSNDCGVVRDADGLRMAAETLADLAKLSTDLPAREVATYEVNNVLRVARAIVASAFARLESRGSHTRSDYPEPSDALLGRLVHRSGLVPSFVRLHRAAVQEPTR